MDGFEAQAAFELALEAKLLFFGEFAQIGWPLFLCFELVCVILKMLKRYKAPIFSSPIIPSISKHFVVHYVIIILIFAT